ncbi:MAG: ABC transporter ATP-binding protein/permease [Lachnospiraceae bacterium]|nr:ABC transporter ATP-binding protein/permease [Lachnospiraceae bacterium]
MMINKRLIGTVKDSRKYIVGNVVAQWCSLIANIVMMIGITRLFSEIYNKTYSVKSLCVISGIIITVAIVQFVCSIISAKMSYLSSKSVKKTLREKIYLKLLSLGAAYKESVKTSEVVQVAVEGCDQLETYFGAYLPQFFYAMIAPLTLFTVLMFVNIPSAVVLLICVPMIPVSIAVVQTWAKKLLSKYWGQYTALGDTFLENLQGLTTLKIYQADEFKNKQMNEESEKFRKITMKVLTMQLNSITIMDLIAYGGAALGVIMASTQFKAGNISIAGAMLIIMLSADFFIPMRRLGSYFHIAMNGMAASDKIFKLLDYGDDISEENCINENHSNEGNSKKNYLEESHSNEGNSKKNCMNENYSKENIKDELQRLEENRKGITKYEFPPNASIICKNLFFSYKDNPDKEIINNANLTFTKGSLTALVGESGCGKSTIAAILMGRNKGYKGSISVGDIELSDIELSDIAEESLMKNVTYISHQSFLFKGTVKDNLIMAKNDATDDELWNVLNRVNLGDFLRSENGLDTKLTEDGRNFSGGQRQRLALARALLHNSPYYIFDEATSNIDVESEDLIMQLIYELAKDKTVIMISHRLANVENADCIYVLDKGNVAGSGTHKELLNSCSVYSKLWNTQMDLENYGLERGVR